MVEKSKSLIPAPASRDPPELAGRHGVAVILWRIVTVAESKPLALPTAPPDLPDMRALVRLHACLRLFLLDVEYALSPSGQLRGILKLAIRITLVVTVVALCLAGILACVSMVLTIMVVITGQVVEILWNLLISVLLLIGLVAIAGVGVLALRLLVGSGGKG